MKSTFAAYSREKRDHVNARLAKLGQGTGRDARDSGQTPNPIHDASQYALTNGGKRIRAILVYSAASALGMANADDTLDFPACAIEMIHSYSLVHDDLPAMDDDDLRRGIPSCHKAYDEATAILVGDALQARAFELLADADSFTDSQRIAMIKTLAAASGLQGMVGGQAIDTAATGSDMTLEQLQAMHALKTGALIRAALAMGGIASGASKEGLAALDLYGKHIGLAFQVVDDILDVEGDTETLGKTQGKDNDANKPTYVKLLGLDGAKDEARRHLRAALAALDGFGESADNLRELARYIVDRDR